ncbi:MAG TPA: hypothetical protein VFI65_07345 [Streptosporangiaceae bacterium]|nr:hypothetical protein [Streptosporangiaceae bacterium]
MKVPTWRFKPIMASFLATTAATLALAGSIGATAPAASANLPQVCSWKPIGLTGGWQSANADFFGTTGDPSYCVENGIIYLSGSIDQSTPGGNIFGSLPQGVRPTSEVDLPVYTLGGTSGTLEIWTDGTMLVGSGVNNTATRFTSLAGISFPEAGAALTPIPLSGQWVPSGSAPSYVVEGGTVYLTGGASNAAANPNTFFSQSLPAAMVPDHCVQTNVETFNGDRATAFIASAMLFATGGIQAANDSVHFTSLGGIAYPQADAGWQPLTLQSAWTAANSGVCVNGAPMYYVRNGIVYLSGAVTSATQFGGGLIGTLPAAAWPSHTLYLTLDTADGQASLQISPSGQLTLFDGPSHPDETSLSGISYQVSS